MAQSFSDKKTNELLQEVLSELRGLRQDTYLFVPSETLDEYSNHDRILNSYQEAVKEYPAR